jgi:AAA+ ATPase superfamily predicted ATPase
MLVLCGSSIGMMERETLVYGAPLYGRRTAQLRVYPLGFENFSRFFPRVGFDRRLQYYAMVGGIPAYVKQLDKRLSARENLAEKFLQPDAYLFNEADFILKEETREPRQYFSILRAIALGKHKFGEIVNETGIEKTSLHRYLYTLDELQIVVKRVPVTENPEKSRRGLYYLTDNYFRLWFDMVFPNRSELVVGNMTSALTRFDQAFLHHAASSYEEVGIEILRRFQEDLFPFSRIGKWWERNNEIDIVALGPGNDEILFAEVKWSSRPVGINVFHRLKETSNLAPGQYRSRRYALVSRSGFTPAMKKLAREEDVLLIHGERKV